ncbi:MAG: phosphoribosylamine--glycine ligase [Phycisphaerales bacterium]
MMGKSSRTSRTLPDSIRALVIGGGGREHALVWRLKQSKSVKSIHSTHAGKPGEPGGNAGLRALAQPLDFEFNTKQAYRISQFVRANNINLIVIGPEDPLAAGLVDTLEELFRRDPGPEVAIFGPNRAAAQLEADKAWAKQLMRSAAIPTGDARIFTDERGAIEYIRTREELPVVKATGLAAGKGVVVPSSRMEAETAIREMLSDKKFGDAGARILLEEKLSGPEVSVFALIDGRNVIMLEACQDHKRLGEGDTGPNTGGMGAYCPTPVISDQQLAIVGREIIVATLDALKREDIEYRGCLYAGLMLTPAGPKVIEFNVRFGDPECQCLMRRLTGDFGRLLYATATGRLDLIQDSDFGFNTNAAEQHVCCVVLASGGYPLHYQKGVPIHGLEEAEKMPGVTVFHAGTTRASGELRTDGGRVLNVVAVGASIREARDRANAAAEVIQFVGKTYRKDIAWQVVANETAARSG